MGSQADAAFRLIEAELLAHRPAEPSSRTAFRRPGTFEQTAEHHAVAVGETRFDRAEDTHTRGGARRRPYLAACKHRHKQLGIVGRIDQKTGCGFAGSEF